MALRSYAECTNGAWQQRTSHETASEWRLPSEMFQCGAISRNCATLSRPCMRGASSFAAACPGMSLNCLLHGQVCGLGTACKIGIVHACVWGQEARGGQGCGWDWTAELRHRVLRLG